MSRIADKIKEIMGFLDELETLAPKTFEEYKSSIEKKAACERYVEKIVEAATDIAFFAIKAKKLDMPEEDIDAFRILSENKLITGAIASKLKDAKGMRNILSHQYGKVDDGLVYNAVSEELSKDIKLFISEIKKAMK